MFWFGCLGFTEIWIMTRVDERWTEHIVFQISKLRARNHKTRTRETGERKDSRRQNRRRWSKMVGRSCWHVLLDTSVMPIHPTRNRADTILLYYSFVWRVWWTNKTSLSWSLARNKLYSILARFKFNSTAWWWRVLFHVSSFSYQWTITNAKQKYFAKQSTLNHIYLFGCLVPLNCPIPIIFCINYNELCLVNRFILSLSNFWTCVIKLKSIFTLSFVF